MDGNVELSDRFAPLSCAAAHLSPGTFHSRLPPVHNPPFSFSESEQSQGDTLCADCGEFEKFTVSDTPDGESLIKFGCGCGVGQLLRVPSRLRRCLLRFESQLRGSSTS